MSRVFDTNAANRLTATGVLAVSAPSATFGCYIKDDKTGGFDRAFFGLGSIDGGVHRRWINARRTSGRIFARLEGIVSPDLDSGVDAVVDQEWVLVVVRADEVTPATASLWVDGVEKDSSELSGNAIVFNNGAVHVGCTASGSAPAKGKVAHAFVFTRALSDTEIADLFSGGNPSALDATGRYAYYPMEDDSLVNEWEADSGVGSLVMSGTVASDDADNPTVGAVVLDPAVTTTDTLQPGEDFTLTATNFAAPPVSPVTLTPLDENGEVITGITPITVAVTITGSGPYTATGTMPTLAEAVTAGNSIPFGSTRISLST